MRVSAVIFFQGVYITILPYLLVPSGSRVVGVDICWKELDGGSHWCRVGVDIGMLGFGVDICHEGLGINIS